MGKLASSCVGCKLKISPNTSSQVSWENPSVEGWSMKHFLRYEEDSATIKGTTKKKEQYEKCDFQWKNEYFNQALVLSDFMPALLVLPIWELPTGGTGNQQENTNSTILVAVNKCQGVCACHLYYCTLPVLSRSPTESCVFLPGYSKRVTQILWETTSHLTAW